MALSSCYDAGGIPNAVWCPLYRYGFIYEDCFQGLRGERKRPVFMLLDHRRVVNPLIIEQQTGDSLLRGVGRFFWRLL